MEIFNGNFIGEIKQPIKRIMLYIILLMPQVFYNIELIPNGAPFNSLVAVYLIFLSVILIYYYYEVVAEIGIMKKMLIGIAMMILIWYVVRFAKFKLFHEAEAIKRFCWYLYYLPMLSISQLFLYVSLYMDTRDDEKLSKKLYGLSAVTIGLILLVLTNDYHQLVFGFNENFNNWDSQYVRKFFYFFIVAWESILYLISFIIMIKRCRVITIKKIAWIALVPFIIGIPVLGIDFLGILKIKGQDLVDITSVYVFMIASFIDVCLQIGLIPNNKSYSEILKSASMDVCITDDKGNAVFTSDKACDFGKFCDEEVKHLVKKCEDNKGRTIILGDTAVRFEKIRNGYGLWKQDIKDINIINEELQQVQEKLREEGELTRLNNELKEKRIKLEARTKLYDQIALETKYQTEQIYKLSDENNEEIIFNNSRLICIYAAFIKRYANLMLLSENSEKINMMELGLSLQESLRFINGYGIPGDYMGDSYIEIKGRQILAIYKAFEKFIEYDIQKLKAVYVRILGNGLVKFTFEGISAEVPLEIKELLKNEELSYEVIHEDNDTFLRIKCFDNVMGDVAL